MKETKERRNCCEVINEMIKKIPEHETEFIEKLKWNHEDASYKAPEETLQWNRTMETLMTYIPAPRKTWEFEVLSIFTTRPIAELKALHSSNNVDIPEED